MPPPTHLTLAATFYTFHGFTSRTQAHGRHNRPTSRPFRHPSVLHLRVIASLPYSRWKPYFCPMASSM